MSDAWVNVSALAFPRRQMVVQFTESDLFAAEGVVCGRCS